MKLSTKIGFNYIIIFSLVILITGSVIGFYLYDSLENQIYSYLFSSNRSGVSSLTTFVNDQKETSAILAAASVYLDILKTPKDSSQYLSVKAKIDSRFLRTLEIDKNISELYILDKNGKVIASSDKEEEGQDRSNDLFFTEAKNKTYLKDVYFYGNLNKLVYSVSSPINDNNGDFLGVSVLMYSPEILYGAVQGGDTLYKTEESFLVNRDKYFLSPSIFLGSSVVLKTKAETKNIEACFSKKEVDFINQNGYAGLEDFLGKDAFVDALDYRGVEVIATHLYFPATGWCYVTKIDKSEILQKIMTLVIILVAVFVLSVILFIIISYFIARRIVRPIINLSSTMKKVEAGDLNVKIENKSKDEIGALSKEFENMVASVKMSREEVDRKVEEQTKEIVGRDAFLRDQQEATMNILHDTDEDKTRVNALLSSIGDGVIAVDDKANLIFMNKSAEDMLGWKEEEVVGKNIYGFLALVDGKNIAIPEAKRPFTMALKLRNKFYSTLQADYYYVRKDGEKFPVAVNTTPVILNNKVIGAIDAFRDMTQEKNIDKAKTEFVSLASHQLKNPLTSIKWNLEAVLDEKMGKPTETQKKFLMAAQDSSNRMTELIDALLSVAKIDAGIFVLTLEPYNISEISDSVLEEMVPSIIKKEIEIKKNYSKILPKINVDVKLTRIIFQNLISNAIKYTPEKGEVSVSIEEKEKNVLITVKDNGYGIPKKDQPRIFEKLFRADNIKEKETDGTGLGLYLVKAVLDQSGGRIWFESEENKGTSFYVEIPLLGMKAKKK